MVKFIDNFKKIRWDSKPEVLKLYIKIILLMFVFVGILKGSQLIIDALIRSIG